MGQKFRVEVDEYWPEILSESTSREWSSWSLDYEDAKSLYESILSGFDGDGESWFNGNFFEADCYFSKRKIKLPVIVRIRVELPYETFCRVKSSDFGVVNKSIINTDRHEALEALI